MQSAHRNVALQLRPDKARTGWRGFVAGVCPRGVFPPDIKHVSPFRGPAAARASDAIAPVCGVKSEPLVTHSGVSGGNSPTGNLHEAPPQTGECREAIPAPHHRRGIRPAWQFKSDLRTRGTVPDPSSPAASVPSATCRLRGFRGLHAGGVCARRCQRAIVRAP